MAITNSSDISVVLSGGTTNISVNNSLGGEPSSAPITSGNINNLFDDVAPRETEEGHEDYRCIYFFNDGETSVFLINLWILDDFLGGSTIELGIEQRNEIQRITLDNATVTGGSLTFSYRGQNFISNFDSDLGAWATELQSTLNGLTDGAGARLLTEVNVSAQAIGTDRIIFDINFNGSDGARNHDAIIIESNNLTPSVVESSVSTPQEGSPINTVAVSIGLETTPPGGIGFFAPSESSPISIPRLDPEDGFPLWIKRTTVAGTSAKEQDGFSLRFAAETLEPAV